MPLTAGQRRSDMTGTLGDIHALMTRLRRSVAQHTEVGGETEQAMAVTLRTVIRGAQDLIWSLRGQPVTRSWSHRDENGTVVDVLAAPGDDGLVIMTVVRGAFAHAVSVRMDSSAQQGLIDALHGMGARGGAGAL